jgi:hypothetical protein
LAVLAVVGTVAFTGSAMTMFRDLSGNHSAAQVLNQQIGAWHLTRLGWSKRAS